MAATLRLAISISARQMLGSNVASVRYHGSARESEREGDAGIIAPRPYASALRFNEILDDGKAESRPARAALARTIGPVKAIEYVGNFVPGEGASRVMNLHHRLSVAATSRYCDTSLSRCVSRGVTEDVQQYLT
jgi:hypothetical protein